MTTVLFSGHPRCSILLYWNFLILKVGQYSVVFIYYILFIHSFTDGHLDHFHLSVQFSSSVISNSLQPRGLQHTRPPCPSPTPSLLKLMSVESVMPSNHLIPCHPFSFCLQSFPASESFQMSQIFASGGQSIGVSASISVGSCD